jgi:hypothetical protein
MCALNTFTLEVKTIIKHAYYIEARSHMSLLGWPPNLLHQRSQSLLEKEVINHADLKLIEKLFDLESISSLRRSVMAAGERWWRFLRSFSSVGHTQLLRND